MDFLPITGAPFLVGKKAVLAVMVLLYGWSATAAESPAESTTESAAESPMASTSESPTESKATSTAPAAAKASSDPLANSVDKESRRHVWPSDGPVGESFREVAKDLRCPTCTGLSVLESDAPFSVQIKDLVKEQVEAGKNKEEILQYFTDRFGPWILRAPPKSGFNLLAWALPLGMLILGPPLIWFFVWRKRKVISTVGVRPDSLIISEMQDRLARLRTGRGDTP